MNRLQDEVSGRVRESVRIQVAEFEQHRRLERIWGTAFAVWLLGGWVAIYLLMLDGFGISGQFSAVITCLVGGWLVAVYSDHRGASNAAQSALNATVRMRDDIDQTLVHAYLRGQVRDEG